jgi:hypothetical protein
MMVDLSDRMIDIVRQLETEGRLGERTKGPTKKDELRFGGRGSLSIMVGGTSRGDWYDHERQEGGGPWDLIKIRGGYDGDRAKAWLRDKLGIETDDGSGILATYDYTDERGVLLFQVVRYPNHKFLQRRPDGNGGWTWKLGNTRRVLYRLPELIAAKRAGNGHRPRLYLCEGEKDVDRLRNDWAVTATTNPGGAAIGTLNSISISPPSRSKRRYARARQADRYANPCRGRCLHSHFPCWWCISDRHQRVLRKLRMGSGGDARGIERLHPAMRSRMWQPGQSGNPSGHSGEYGTAIKLAQRAAPKAMRRLIELMDSEDERVAAVACNAILDRAFGKPKVAEEQKDDLVARVEAMSPEERVRMAQELVERGARYIPAYEAALAKSRSLRLAAGAEQSDGDG